MFTALGSTSHKIKNVLYQHAEWAKTRNLTEGIFDFHFQTGEMAQLYPVYTEKPNLVTNRAENRTAGRLH